jgi:hypothetical protein
VEALIKKYRSKGLLMDANLMLAYLVGFIDERHLKSCRATTRYFGAEDFPMLCKFVSLFSKLVTTPHILTEVSNLSGKLPQHLQVEFRYLLRHLIGKLNEQSLPSIEVAAGDEFLRFGLTDTVIGISQVTNISSSPTTSLFTGYSQNTRLEW